MWTLSDSTILLESFCEYQYDLNSLERLRWTSHLWDSDVANLEGLILEPDDLGGRHLELEKMEQLRLKKLLAWLHL